MRWVWIWCLHRWFAHLVLESNGVEMIAIQMTHLWWEHVSLFHDGFQAILGVTLPLWLHQALLPKIGPLGSEDLRRRSTTQRLIIMPGHQFSGAASLHIGLLVPATMQLESWTVLTGFQLNLFQLFDLWSIDHSHHIMLLHITTWKILVEVFMVDYCMIHLILHLLMLSFCNLPV